MFMPYEIIIIGTIMHNRKHDVTYKEVQEYIKRRGFNVEIDEDFTNFEFIKSTNSGYHIDKIPPMNPAMVQFLMQ